MPFEFVPQAIEGLVLVKPRVFPDGRGFFLEHYKHTDFAAAGIGQRFSQSNHSRSAKGVLRGLHYQLPPREQGKLVRVVAGSVWDVAVDLRQGSPTFGKWLGVELSAENRTMFWIPGGFAHGFVALSDNAELEYQCTAEYDKEAEAGVRWDDPDLAIDWPAKAALVSDKDAALPPLAQARTFPRGYRFGGQQ